MKMQNNTFSIWGDFEYTINCTDTSGSLEVNDDFTVTSPVLFNERSYNFNVERKNGAYVKLEFKNYISSGIDYSVIYS